MSRKILALILCLMVLSVAARAAEQRPMVGFLPLQGHPGSYTNVIPELVYWQISRIPTLGIVDMGSMVDCMQLDRLSMPADAGDATRYSQLAEDTGVNYLVIGAVEHVNRSRARFRLAIFSASDPRFFREQVYKSGISNLPAAAVRAAKWIASEVRVQVEPDVEFDTTKIPAEVLRLIDQSSRLCTGCESDQSVLSKASELSSRAQTLCPSSQMVSNWARSTSFYRQRGMGGYTRFRRRPGTNGRIYGGRWAHDLSPSLYTLSANGKLIWRLSHTWRADLENTRGLRRDPKKLKSYLGALTARNPQSAYIHYCAGRALSVVDEGPDMIREYNAALRLNPDSFRLRMKLVSAYIDWHNNDKALAELKPALKRWPNRSECHLLAAAFYRGRKHYDKAAEEMKTVVELAPGIYANHRTLADDYMRAGKVVESVREMAKSDEGFRKGIVTFSLVLTGVFLLGLLGMAALVKILLRT